MRRKQYKAAAPITTITNIRRTLWERLGILLKEINYKNHSLYSCRISIHNKNIQGLSIGTNGKGLSYEYALASAHGEFMERLQNQMMIFHFNFACVDSFNRNKQTDFEKELLDRGIALKYYMAPDEVILSSTSVEEIRKIEKRMFTNLSNFYAGRAITLVPYYSVLEEKEVLMPIDLIQALCTSNGMCAGNTPKEAILQGISEILERYVLRLLYQDNITPPTIPLENFHGYDIYHIIESLRLKYNVDFIVKDCSLGKGIPTIGVLVVNEDCTKYNFHLGADPSAVTALERTITEMFQGRTSLEMHDVDVDYQKKIETDPYIRELEFGKTYTKGNGHFPLSILSSMPSYEFNGLNEEWGQSDDMDIKLMVDLLSNMGVDIYVRDVSFLGFPAYSIYIPKLSESRGVFSKANIPDDFSQLFKTVINIEDATKKEIKRLASFISEFPEMSFLFENFNTENFLVKYPVEVSLFFLYLILGDREKSLYYLKKSISLGVNTLSSYGIDPRIFTCMLDILCDEKTKESMTSIYGQRVYTQSLQSINNPFVLFSHTSCFDCGNCSVKGKCNLFTLIDILKSLENQYISNIPDQKKLKEVFGGVNAECLHNI